MRVTKVLHSNRAQITRLVRLENTHLVALLVLLSILINPYCSHADPVDKLGWHFVWPNEIQPQKMWNITVDMKESKEWRRGRDSNPRMV